MIRILLVDDDDLFRRMMRLTLVKMGYVVTEACNGNEAMQAYEQEPAEVMMTDLIMPEKEGLETIRALKKVHPTLKIIAMSSGGRISGTDWLRIAKAMGADRTLSKPFSNDDLTMTLNDLLSQSP